MHPSTLQEDVIRALALGALGSNNNSAHKGTNTFCPGGGSTRLGKRPLEHQILHRQRSKQCDEQPSYTQPLHRQRPRKRSPCVLLKRLANQPSTQQTVPHRSDKLWAERAERAELHKVQLCSRSVSKPFKWTDRHTTGRSHSKCHFKLETGPYSSDPRRGASFSRRPAQALAMHDLIVQRARLQSLSRRSGHMRISAYGCLLAQGWGVRAAGDLPLECLMQKSWEQQAQLEDRSEGHGSLDGSPRSPPVPAAYAADRLPLLLPHRLRINRFATQRLVMTCWTKTWY
jgi:hypothetical protein